MAAATEDNEKVGWRPAFAGSWAAGMEGGEDIDETEECCSDEDDGEGEDVREGWHCGRVAMG